jgi:D-amino-acid dehydrogenase
MSAPKSILIIGGGVIGLCCAWYLRAAGNEVTIAERGPADHDGCSQGNAGLICPSHIVPLAAPGMITAGLRWLLDARSPFYIKPRLNLDLLRWGRLFSRAATPAHVDRVAPLLRDLNLLSRKLYAELADAENDFGLEKKGLLILCDTQHGLDEESLGAQRARALGLAAESVSAARAAELLPGMKLAAAGGIYYPQDCHLTPPRFIASLTRRLESAGVKFLWSREITGWRCDGSRIAAALTPAGELSADEFILAGGAWSPALARDLGLRLPIEAGKGYSLTLPKPRALPAIPAILAEARVAVTPMGTSLRVGGTMEIAGLDESVTRKRVEGIVDSFTRYFPDFSAADFAGVEPWRGLRPCSPDGLPYIGRSGCAGNLTVAAGHAMLGLSLGPATGRLVAQLLSGQKTEVDLSPMSPDRYA